MKKILLMTLLVLGTLGSQAQQFGVRGGLNLANIGADAENNSLRPGLHVGAYYQVPLRDKFLLEPEAQLSFQGSNADTDPAFNQAITQINIPIIVKYKVTEAITVDAGPYAGFIRGAKIKSDDGDIDNKDFFNSLDFGVGLGASYQMTSGINFSIRYLAGLADITDDPSGTEIIIIDNVPVEVEVEEQKITNQVIQFSIGYTINK
jgi:hypothetical protein